MTIINTTAQRRLLENVVNNMSHGEFEAMMNWGGELFQDGIKIGKRAGFKNGIAVSMIAMVGALLYLKYIERKELKQEVNNESEGNY